MSKLRGVAHEHDAARIEAHWTLVNRAVRSESDCSRGPFANKLITAGVAICSCARTFEGGSPLNYSANSLRHSSADGARYNSDLARPFVVMKIACLCCAAGREPARTYYGRQFDSRDTLC